MGKTCAQYKASARAALAGKYWYAFGICLLTTFISGITIGIVELVEQFSGSPAYMDTETYSAALGTPRTAFGLVLFIALTLFVTFPITVGLTRYFIINAKARADINELVYPYKNNLMNIVTAKIKQTVFVYLWSLLFIIPGIVKSFSYFMIDYIMAENPYLSTSRAFEISKNAMYGYRGKAFLLELSFIGWILLGVITGGIGLVFLTPYMQAAMTDFYLDVKQSAIARGIIITGELPD